MDSSVPRSAGRLQEDYTQNEAFHAQQINQPVPATATATAASASMAAPDPFTDGAESVQSNRDAAAGGNVSGNSTPESVPNIAVSDPFASNANSRPLSSAGLSVNEDQEQAHRYFHSRRVVKGNIEKPWMGKKDPKERWVTILPLIGILIGLLISGVLVWDGLRSVVKHKYCLVMSDDFSGGFRSDYWTKEVQLGGFGNGEFEETTGTDENVFVQDGKLMIKATLQDASLLDKDSIVDLLADGTCTSTAFTDCVAATNTSAGNSSVVPPTRSGRINTKKFASIKYGRVEVTARMPKGDWLWPAIWMLPVNETYGAWPASGEIDLVESRGNNHSYWLGGNNVMSSTLHWGPSPGQDAWWRTNSKKSALHSTYADKEYTFGLEWSEKYMFTYINSRLMQAIYINFDEPMWKRGNFASASSEANYTNVNDVWGQTGRTNTPFDQPFYLILNVAVGGTNGWFTDNKNGKPWLDASKNAKKDFWNARSQWFDTWTQPQMEVSKVDMWQQCDGGEL
ncbi:beta- -glucan-binding protein [Ophiostoma piceae UAMH 11346]|uniref:Beta--glucan-binding protein n=1 Tax=Ophiostoma piceae (strain UAMH 11346) TaxID=1262450 RepID=S3C5L9_OPHP1|nr:beta- -glucan-binding protein [Ophiostoma piceae UAMH 11346]